MNRHIYDDLAGYAGRHLLRAHPWPYPTNLPFPFTVATAVYIACGLDGACLNVGSVTRQHDIGLARRIAEHLRDPRKRSTWVSVWVLPLRRETPAREVRRLEGVVGAHLGPTQNRWLPRPAPAEATP